jgi:hypothetical protein
MSCVTSSLWILIFKRVYIIKKHIFLTYLPKSLQHGKIYANFIKRLSVLQLSFLVFHPVKRMENIAAKTNRAS